ncbi:L-lactate oxidase-like [Saccoglossus kowalevskii]
MAADAHCVCLDDFEKYAEKHLSLMTWIYYCSGADGETTLKENRRSFRRYMYQASLCQ